MNLPQEFSDKENDFLEMYEICLNRKRKQNYKVRDTHFQKWSENEFLGRFRLTKYVTRFLIMKISDRISPVTNRNHERNRTLYPAEMVLIALRFFATGCFLRVAGDFTGG